MRRILLALALPVLAPACAPKGSGEGGATPTASPRATPLPPAGGWGKDVAPLVELGLGGARTLWNEPAIRPGERLRWLVTSADFPDRFVDVRLESGADGAERWTLVSGHPSAPKRTVEVTRRDGRVVSLAQVAARGGPRMETALAEDLAALPAAILGTAGETAFTAAGGTLVGNEVLRVPAGEFRARHAILATSGRNWHLYLVRTVPGGVAKVEMFPEGAIDPALVLELDEFTRVKQPAN